MKKIVIFIATIILLASCSPTNSFKEYIIEHSNDIVLKNITDSVNNETYYTLKCDNMFYYSDITIVLYGNTDYKILLWGNRNSLFWYFKKDKIISVDITESIYLNKDVRNDYLIINILDNIKHNPKIKIF